LPNWLPNKWKFGSDQVMKRKRFKVENVIATIKRFKVFSTQ
jgi:hypothetical protein